MSRLLRDEWCEIASALFDREIEVATDWRYALRFLVFPVPNRQGNNCDESKSNYVKHVIRIGKIKVAAPSLARFGTMVALQTKNPPCAAREMLD